MAIPIKNIFLTELKFFRSSEVTAPLKYSFEIQVGYTINEENKTAQVNLKLDLSETTKKEVTMSCCMVGVFDIADKDVMPMPLTDFLSINAPSAIFPFLRESVSNITLHAGMNPIFIPMINFKEMRDKKLQEVNKQLTPEIQSTEENLNEL